jgi:hypothetical protein
MIDKPKKLFDTARTQLTAPAARSDHFIPSPQLPIATARQDVRSLLIAEFAKEVSAPVDDAGFAWRSGEDGDVLVLRATETRARPDRGRESCQADTGAHCRRGLGTAGIDAGASGGPTGAGPRSAPSRVRTAGRTPTGPRTPTTQRQDTGTPRRPPSSRLQPSRRRPQCRYWRPDTATSARPRWHSSMLGTLALTIATTAKTR